MPSYAVIPATLGRTVRADVVVRRLDGTIPDLRLAGTKIVATVRRRNAAAPLVEKKNTAAGGNDTQIQVNPAAPGNRLTVTFVTPGEWAALGLSKAENLPYDVAIEEPDGSESTPVEGVLKLSIGATAGAIP